MDPGLLIASPQMKDRFFERAVVLLCQHDDDGALGLIINREGPLELADVFEGMDLDPSTTGDASTLWGGPVGAGSGFVLWRGRASDDEGWNAGPDVAVSPSADRLEQLARAGQRFHLALGYAGWGPGQLEGEIESGSWLFADVDGDIVLETPVDERYDRALALLGLSTSTVLMNPVTD